MRAPNRPQELPPLISVPEACRLLGIGRDVGYRSIALGELPSLRLGRRIFVPTARLLDMLGYAQGRGPAIVEAPGGMR